LEVRAEKYFLSRLKLTSKLWDLRWRRLRALWQTRLGLRGWLACYFGLLDLIGLLDLYEATISLLPGVRGLKPAEIRFLRTIFGDSIPYFLVRIDERAWFGPRFGNFCYVSFHTVNSWGPMHPAVLVHEIVHVWQYVHRGAAYIPRALSAQRSAMGYNYGGVSGLERACQLEDFNYEQMADVIEDAFRLANAIEGQWVPGRGPEILPLYYPFLRELRGAKPHSAYLSFS
jgi:hypothetical protein